MQEVQNPTNPVTPQEFAKKIKEKYPQYADVEDSVLVEKILEKYPQYKDQINFDQPTEVEPIKKKEESESESISPDQELDSPSTQETTDTSSESTELIGPKKPAGFDHFEKIRGSRKGNIQNEDGTVSSHRMAYGEVDGKYVAYPTLFQDPENENEWYEMEGGSFDALEEAKSRGEIYEFDKEEDAKEFAEGSWKTGTPKKEKGGKEKGSNEDEGTWYNKLREFATGSTMLGESVASLPEAFYRIAAMPQNAIADLTGNETLRASPEKFKETFDISNPVLDHYSKETKKLQAETDDYYRRKFGTDEEGNTKRSPSESIADGEYMQAFEQLGGSVAESFAVSTSMMLGGAALGSIGKLAAAATPAFVEQNINELKRFDPKAFEEMSETEKTTKALGMAGAETVFSAIGTGTIGKVYADILKKEGKEQGTIIFKEGIQVFYESVLKKAGAPAAMLGEGVEEVATIITQNMIKGESPFKGVADAFLQGLGGGFVHGAPMNSMQAVDHLNKKIGEKRVNKEIEGSTIYKRAGDLFKEENMSEIDDVQISIAGNKHSRRALESDLKKQVKEGLITEEQSAKNLQLFDQTAKFVRETEGANLTEKNKVKAVNLLRERQQLDESVKGKNKALFKQEHNRIAEIDAQLENLRDNGTGNENKTEQAEQTGDTNQSGTTEGTETKGEGTVEEGQDQSDSGDVRGDTQNVTVSEALNRPVTMEAQGGAKLDTPVKGDMYVDGQTVVVEDTNGKIYEVGNVEEVQGKTLSEMGLQYDKGLEITPDGTIKHEGTEWRIQDELPTNGIEFNEDGSVKSVSLKENGTEKTTMLTGQEAEDAAYFTLLKTAESPQQIEKVNQLLEQDEQFQNELRKVEESTQEETGGDIEQDTESTETTEEGVEETSSLEQGSPKIEAVKKLATDIRNNLKIKQDGNTLNSNPLGGTFAFVWNGAIETLATSLEAGASVAQAIDKAVEFYKKSDLYKKEKAKGAKGITVKEFKERLETKLKPYKEAQVKPKKQPVKKTIRETTGQVDQSKKITTTEKRLTRELYRAEAKGARKAYSVAKAEQRNVKELKEIIKAQVLRTGLSPAKTKQLLGKALQIDVTNEKQVNQFFDQMSRAAVNANLKLDGKNLKKNIDKVKKRIKKHFGKWAPLAQKLVNLKIDNIPANLVQDYTDVMSMLADTKNKDLDWSKVEEILEGGLDKAYENQAEEQYQEKLAEVKEEKDKSKEIALLEETLQNLRPNWSELNEAERDIFRKFTHIPLDWITEHLDKPKLSALIKSLNALDGTNGTTWMDNKTINSVVMAHDSFRTAEKIVAKVGNTFIKPVANIAQAVNNLRKSNKSFTTADYQAAVNNVMVQHIDTVITYIKDLSIYKEILHPITSQFNKAHEESNAVEKRLNAYFNAARKSREGNRVQRLIPTIKQAMNVSDKNYKFDTQVILQLYFRQMEYENKANRADAERKIFSAKDHVDKTMESKHTPYSDRSKARIQELFDTFSTNGEFDVKKVSDYFTEEEKALVKFIRSELETTKQRSMEVNDHQRGETLPYPEDYFPRRVYSKDKDFVDGVDLSQNMAKMVGSQSTKGTASNRRAAKKAQALNFDTMGTFMNHIKEANIEYNVSDAVKSAGMTLSHLGEAQNESLGMLSKALERGIKVMLEAELGHSIYTPTSKISTAYRYLVRRTFNRMLIDPLRLIAADIPSNYVFFYSAYVDKLGAIHKSRKKLSKKYKTGEVHQIGKNKGKEVELGFKDILFKDYGSTHASRLGGSRSVDYKESESSSLSKGAYKEYEQGITDNLLDLMKKNKVTDASDSMSELYYRIADAPAKQIWSLRFDETFKKLTGKEFSTDEYVNNPDYKNWYDKEIKETIKVADKAATVLFNTATKTEQKFNVQAGRGTLKTSINSFMRSFTFNENRVWWDSFNSIIKQGGSKLGADTSKLSGSMELGEAIRTQIIVNGRSIAYSYAIQTMISAVLQFLVPDMDKDEELEERAFKRAVAQHGMLILAGNRGLIFNLGAAITIEGIRKMKHNKDAKDDMTGMTEKYSNDDSLLYVPRDNQSLEQFVGMGGAEGYALQIIIQGIGIGAKFAEKIYNGEEITEDDVLEWKTYQIGVGMASQLLGLPINRVGRIWQKYKEEVKKASEWGY